MLAAFLAALLAGCSASEHPRSTGATTYWNARYGYEVKIPRGWQRARKSLTPFLSDPREILVAATFRPSTRGEDCAQFPTGALHHMPRDGVLVEVQERAGAPTLEFVPRPRHFTVRSGDANIEVVDCVPHPPAFRPHAITFRDGRRMFYVLVAIGTSAPASAQRAAFAILDSLRFDPRRKAAWRASDPPGP